MNSVAKNLKTIRLKAGYTQSDLAQALHVTRQTVSSWETGRNEPDIATLTALAEYLQTDVTTLIYGPKAPPYQTMQKKYICVRDPWNTSSGCLHRCSEVRGTEDLPEW